MTPPGYPPASPHDPIDEVFPNIFFVRGSLQMNAMMRIGRNMTVVRNGDELTVLNSVRLTPEGEAQLDALGSVKHVLRLGYFHGQDDRYYVDRYNAQFWAPAGSRSEPGPAEATPLEAGTHLPMADAELFLFHDTKMPEAAILIRRDGGILIVCDALQHYTDRRHNNWLAALAMPLMGFPLRMLIGPFWKKFMTPAGSSLRPDFDRLLALDFEHLLPAHGTVKRGNAKAAIAATMALDLQDG